MVAIAGMLLQSTLLLGFLTGAVVMTAMLYFRAGRRLVAATALMLLAIPWFVVLHGQAHRGNGSATAVAFAHAVAGSGADAALRYVAPEVVDLWYKPLEDSHAWLVMTNARFTGEVREQDGEYLLPMRISFHGELDAVFRVVVEDRGGDWLVTGFSSCSEITPPCSLESEVSAAQ